MEYSYNVSAIINRQYQFQRGFLIGINHVGKLVGALAAGGDYFLGYVPMPEGVKLVVWIYYSGNDKVDICIDR